MDTECGCGVFTCCPGHPQGLPGEGTVKIFPAPRFSENSLLPSLPAGLEVSFGVPKLSTKETLLWWESSQIEGSFFNDWLKKLEANTVDRVVSESRRSLVLHEDPLKTSARIEKALGIVDAHVSALPGAITVEYFGSPVAS